MKRVVFICCVLISFLQVKSQIIDSVDIQRDCDGTGLIVLHLSSPSQYIYWDSLDGNGNSYQLSNNTIGDTALSVLSCGTYACTIYNQFGAVLDADTFYIACPMRTDVRAHENITCAGDSTGLLKHVVKGGVPFLPDSLSNIEYYNYVWYKNGVQYASGPNDTIIDNLFNGSSQSIPYVSNVIDASGCIFQPLDSVSGLPDTSNIWQPHLLRIDSISINLVHCKGTNTGSFYINVKDGKRYETGNYYNYYLTNINNDTIRIIDRNGMSSNVSSDTIPYYVLFDSLSVGNYTLHIVDSFGCNLDSVIYIPEPDDYSLIVSNHPNIICEQDSTWLTIDYVTGGNPSLEYYWFNENPGDSIYVRSGTYQVVIYDTIYKCEDTLDYILTAPNTIYSNISSDPAFCFGTNTGSISIDSIYGGIHPYNIQWGGVNPDSLYAGTYTLFITDSLGCIYMEDIVVSEHDDVSINPSLYPPSCAGYSDGSIAINITGGNPPLSYNWLFGSGSPDSLFSISAGVYFLQTTDSLGCSYLDSVTLNQPDSLIISFSEYTNPLFCHGGVTLINASIIGGTGNYSLSWNTGNPADTSYQVVVSKGIYTLTVTDDNGCSTYKTLVITEPDSLTINGSFIPSTCDIGGSASITYSGGTSPISYIWSNGATTQTVSDLQGGNHWVIATDSCGDTASYSFTIESHILEATADHYNNPVNFAEVVVTSTTSGGPFTYQWYDQNMNIINGATNQEIFNLCQEWYFVTTTDLNGCEATDSVYATFYFPMEGIIDASSTTVYPDIDLWGEGPYTYLWDNGDVTAHGNICAGNHKVWVTDENGCEVMGEVTVEDIELSLSPSDIIIECDITNLDVELEVTATGGIGDYNYLWSNGQTMNPINLSLYPGLYSVEVTDDNFCKVDTVFRIAAMSSDCIPSVFTPNDDGINDFWNLEDAFLYLDTEIKVYGRYGNLVFKSVGYDNPWDGKNQSDNFVKDGAYFYVIDLGKGLDKITGTVSIIR